MRHRHAGFALPPLLQVVGRLMRGLLRLRLLPLLRLRRPRPPRSCGRAGEPWPVLPMPRCIWECGGCARRAATTALAQLPMARAIYLRAISLRAVPTAVLSRQTAGVRGAALILNLPGRPRAIREAIDEVWRSVPYCVDLLGGPYHATHEAVVRAFRPAGAARAT